MENQKQAEESEDSVLGSPSFAVTFLVGTLQGFFARAKRFIDLLAA